MAAGAHAAVCLALGRPPTVAPSAGGWAGLLALAAHERCVPLMWLRSAAAIRAAAPEVVAQRWRMAALAAAADASTGWRSVAAVLESCSAVGISPVVLKGAPLAVRLYGDPSARPCADIDLFTGATDRSKLRSILDRLGWRHVEGKAPGEEAFVLGPEQRLLEVHSTLLHPRFAYLPMPEPEANVITVEGAPVRAHGGATLPGYLAAHMATHETIPLLWWIDMTTLWENLDDAARLSAQRAAREAGVDRYLAWALRGVAAVQRLAERPDESAARTLALRARGWSVHPMWRHLLLAPSWQARREALAGWLWPSWMAGTYGASPAGFARRMGRHARALLPTRRPAR